MKSEREERGRKMFRRKHGIHPGPEYPPAHRRIPLAAKILMLIGIITVLYLLITYVLIPVLAWLTPA